jgi:hypothetical protein
MGEHFCAFSFVDRITSLKAGASIRGCYTIPAKVEAFPTSLVAEAVGQLAAWAAMSAVDFSHRPVAGIAGTIELLSTVRPGQVLELAAPPLGRHRRSDAKVPVRCVPSERPPPRDPPAPRSQRLSTTV